MHVGALGREQEQPAQRDRAVEQPAVGADLDGGRPALDREVPEARVRRVEDPEAVLARLDRRGTGARRR